MPSIANRRWVIAFGVLLIVGSLASLAMFGVLYSMRWTYVRPVYYAAQNGQDPYQVARSCAEEMAGDFMTVALIYAACVTLLAVVVTVLAARRVT